MVDATTWSRYGEQGRKVGDAGLASKGRACLIIAQLRLRRGGEVRLAAAQVDLGQCQGMLLTCAWIQVVSVAGERADIRYTKAQSARVQRSEALNMGYDVPTAVAKVTSRTCCEGVRGGTTDLSI